jgi:hypothetical protein
MAVQPDPELERQRGAAEDERIRAVIGDRRGDREADTVAVERPMRQRPAYRSQGFGGGARRNSPTRSRNFSGSAAWSPGITS